MRENRDRKAGTSPFAFVGNVAAIAEAGLLGPFADTPVCHGEAVLGSGVQLLSTALPPTAPNAVVVGWAPDGVEVATVTPVTQAIVATTEMMAR